MAKKKLESWDDLTDTLRRCQAFVEDAIRFANENRTAEEDIGIMHSARLLGHITDALVNAVWIKGVVIAHLIVEKDSHEN